MVAGARGGGVRDYEESTPEPGFVSPERGRWLR